MFERSREDAKKDRGMEMFLRNMDRRPTPTQLPDAVLETTGRRREAQLPAKVTAHIPVSYAYTDTLTVDGEVVAWTDKAVLVRAVLTPGTEPQHVWVWANAVKRT